MPLTNLVCNTPATPLLHLDTNADSKTDTHTDSEKTIRRIDYISRFGVYLLKGGMDETMLQKQLSYYACGRYPMYMYDEKRLKEDVHMAIDKAQLATFLLHHCNKLRQNLIQPKPYAELIIFQGLACCY